VLDDPTPLFGGLLLNLLSPPNNWDHVGVVVRLKQCETLAIGESAIEVDSLDICVKTIENTEELSEDTASV
jgi:hypothetical protein